MPLSWFALQVRTKAEALTEKALSDRSYETFLPTYTDCRRYTDRIRKVQAALFPGYLFCRLDPDRRLPILTTPGVLQIVSTNGAPAPIEETELEALRHVVGSNTPTMPWPYLKKGDVARIEYGALAGLDGILLAEKGSDLLVLSVSILQRSVAVQIDRTWVRPIGLTA
jgi:transcription antitermination factor NusG